MATTTPTHHPSTHPRATTRRYAACIAHATAPGRPWPPKQPCLSGAARDRPQTNTSSTRHATQRSHGRSIEKRASGLAPNSRPLRTSCRRPAPRDRRPSRSCIGEKAAAPPALSSSMQLGTTASAGREQRSTAAFARGRARRGPRTRRPPRTKRGTLTLGRIAPRPVAALLHGGCCPKGSEKLRNLTGGRRVAIGRHLASVSSHLPACLGRSQHRSSHHRSTHRSVSGLCNSLHAREQLAT
jgi:hypothetical protein